eukprot:COSAG01_NODE_869_length_13031_cov_28.329467_10_plen_130_part_00
MLSFDDLRSSYHGIVMRGPLTDVLCVHVMNNLDGFCLVVSYWRCAQAYGSKATPVPIRGLRLQGAEQGTHHAPYFDSHEGEAVRRQSHQWAHALLLVHVFADASCLLALSVGWVGGLLGCVRQASAIVF